MAILLEVRVIMGALIKSQAFSDLGEEEQVDYGGDEVGVGA